MAKRKLKTIAERWQEFRDKCVPKNAGESQIIQTRMAFYAGWKDSLMATGFEITEISNEDECVEELQRFHDEVDNFFRSEIAKLYMRELGKGGN